MAFALGGNLLDFLVLAILRYGDMYGYVLTHSRTKDSSTQISNAHSG